METKSKTFVVKGCCYDLYHEEYMETWHTVMAESSDAAEMKAEKILNQQRMNDKNLSSTSAYVHHTIESHLE